VIVNHRQARKNPQYVDIPYPLSHELSSGVLCEHYTTTAANPKGVPAQQDDRSQKQFYMSILVSFKSQQTNGGLIL
jgi:hypothetical protein